MPNRLHKQLKLYFCLNRIHYEDGGAGVGYLAETIKVSRRTVERYLADFMALGVRVSFDYSESGAWHNIKSKDIDVTNDPMPFADYNLLESPKHKRLYRLCDFIALYANENSQKKVDISLYKENYNISRYTALRDLDELRQIGFEFQYLSKQKVYSIIARPEVY